MSDLKYGKNTVQVEAVLAEVETWTAAEAKIAGAARDAARGAAMYAAGDAARYAAGYAAGDAARDAVLCAIACDLIPDEYQKVLNVGLNAVREYRVKKENASAHGDTRRRALAEWARKRAKKARKKAERSGGTVHQYERADILGEIADALEGGEE